MYRILLLSMLLFLSIFCLKVNSGLLIRHDESYTKLEVKDMRGSFDENGDRLKFGYYGVEVHTELFPGENLVFKYLPIVKRETLESEDPQIERVVALFQFDSINFGLTISQNNDAHNSDMENNVPNGEFYPFAHDFQKYLLSEDEFKKVYEAMTIQPWSPFFLRFMRFVLAKIKDVSFLKKHFFLQKIKELKDIEDKPYWVEEVRWKKELDEDERENWVQDGSLIEYFDLAKIIPKEIGKTRVREDLCVCSISREYRDEKVMICFEPIDEMKKTTGDFTQYMISDQNEMINYYLSDIDKCYQSASKTLEKEYTWVRNQIITTLEAVNSVKEDALFSLLTQGSRTEFSFRTRLDQQKGLRTISKNKRKLESDSDQESVEGSSSQSVVKKRKVIKTSRKPRVSLKSRTPVGGYGYSKHSH